MTSPLVSICVPIYNVEPYIERCVRSIMKQTYENIEYIFVDDGSTDDSISVLKKVLQDYPERNKQVKVITNNHNYGTAYTRRIYTENARGEYIASIDSDDYIESEMIQYLVEKAMETNADIVVSGYYIETKSTSVFKPYVCDNETDFLKIALQDLLPYLWNKLIKRSLFVNGRYCYAPIGMDYLEDRLMIFLLGTKVKRIATIDKPLYHYVYRYNSISQGKNEKHFRCLVRYWEEIDKLLYELKLTDKYNQLVGNMKIEDKAHLLMFCDNRSRKQFVDLYADEERIYTPKLTRGVALMYWLTKHHLWFLTYCYQCYIRWLDYMKNRS